MRFFVLLLFLCWVGKIAAQSDMAYTDVPSTSLCLPVLNYTQAIYNVTKGGCTSMIDANNKISSLPTLLASLKKIGANAAGAFGSVTASMCASSLQVYQCATTYLRFNGATGLPPSKQLCEQTRNRCDLFKDFISLASGSDYNEMFPCDFFPNSTIFPTAVNPLMAPVQEMFIPSCGSLSPTSLCYDVLEYAKDGVYFSQPEEVLETRVRSSWTAMLLVDVASGCRTRLMQSLCGRIYPRCESSAFDALAAINPLVKGTSVFPRLPCRSLCEETRDTCSASIAQLLASKRLTQDQVHQLFDCDQMTNTVKTCQGQEAGGYPQFPNGTITFIQTSFGGVGAACNPASSFASPSPSSSQPQGLTCPYPLLLVEGNENSKAFETRNIIFGSCAMPCRTVLFTPDEWDFMSDVVGILAIVSFVLSTFLFLTWLVFPSRRKQRFEFQLLIQVWLYTFFMFLTLVANDGGLKENGCETPTWSPEFEDGNLCVAQGFIVMVTSISGSIWFFFIALGLFLNVVLEKRLNKSQEDKMFGVALVLAWGYPLIAGIIGLATEQIASNNFLMVCNFKDYTNLSDYDKRLNQGVEYGLQYAPISFFVSLGTLLYLTTLLSFLRNRKHLRSSIQTIVLLFLFTFFFVVWFTIRYWVETHHDDLKEEVTTMITYNSLEYFSSLVTQRPPHYLEHPGSRPYHGWRLLNINLAFAGAFIFIAKGLNKETFTLWWNLIVKQRFDDDGSAECHNLVASSPVSTPREMGSGQQSVQLSEVSFKTDGHVVASVPMSPTSASRPLMANASSSAASSPTGDDPMPENVRWHQGY